MMILPYEPEPACDIAAQQAATLDPAHPKRAMWHDGTIWAHPDDCARLNIDPSDETLAAILGYVRPKSEVMRLCLARRVAPIVVQARNDDDAVITEMLCLPSDQAAAERALAGHGRIVVETVAGALKRRATLREVE